MVLGISRKKVPTFLKRLRVLTPFWRCFLNAVAWPERFPLYFFLVFHYYWKPKMSKYEKQAIKKHLSQLLLQKWQIFKKKPFLQQRCQIYQVWLRSSRYLIFHYRKLFYYPYFSSPLFQIWPLLTAKWKGCPSPLHSSLLVG